MKKINIYEKSNIIETIEPISAKTSDIFGYSKYYSLTISLKLYYITKKFV